MKTAAAAHQPKFDENEQVKTPRNQTWLRVTKVRLRVTKAWLRVTTSATKSLYQFAVDVKLWIDAWRGCSARFRPRKQC